MELDKESRRGNRVVGLILMENLWLRWEEMLYFKTYNKFESGLYVSANFIIGHNYKNWEANQ